MVRWILIAVLAVGVTATGIWGYQEHQEKNAILVQAENSYQRSFHDLTYHMDLLHDKIGTTLAMNTKEQLSPQLVEVWRLTSEAHSDVGQLPLALLPFNKTEEFLSKIGEFSYKVAVRDLENEPLSDEEVETLQSLYETSADIEKELRNVQHMVLEENLRWMDVQLALATNDQQADNTIIDGFETVEKTVSSYSEGNFGPSLTGTSKENHEYQFINGNEISEEEAREKAKEIFRINNDTDLTVAESGEGANVAVYSMSYDNEDKHGYMDISQKGGHPISLIVNREVGEQKISLYEGMETAATYLDEEGFENLEAFQSSQYDHVGVYNFIYKQDDVRIYPDSIQVKVALDNGDILGLSTRDYFRNHQERDLVAPELSLDEARDKVNPNVEIQEEHVSVIDNNLGEEVLTYEFLGTLGNDSYRIFIDANTGVEVKVEKLDPAEARL
ncbi:germination protein YpeB [Aquibacillus koreensis]|uniref:Germination protein YpeB n=1 Tax=Aquibacillus koreensis TaxID=279446 RepID=A0A9X3WFH9_9BACI|nr:germination protein YpeB [Aquibacillus koreensis]MCT2537404.1 germination protein YpeB [Aquibacillus koreensis]MDC3418850.1 germination protein YpeB [Aquibacillus koreensis]